MDECADSESEHGAGASLTFVNRELSGSLARLRPPVHLVLSMCHRYRSNDREANGFRDGGRRMRQYTVEVFCQDIRRYAAALSITRGAADRRASARASAIERFARDIEREYRAVVTDSRSLSRLGQALFE